MLCCCYARCCAFYGTQYAIFDERREEAQRRVESWRACRRRRYTASAQLFAPRMHPAQRYIARDVRTLRRQASSTHGASVRRAVLRAARMFMITVDHQRDEYLTLNREEYEHIYAPPRDTIFLCCRRSVMS